MVNKLDEHKVLMEIYHPYIYLSIPSPLTTSGHRTRH